MSLRRRRILALSGAALAGLAGCITDGSGDGDKTDDQSDGENPAGAGDDTQQTDTPDDGKQTEQNPSDTQSGTIGWTYDAGGGIATIEDGVLYGRESIKNGQGGVLALDVETGDRLWRYGETGGYSTFTRPVVDGAVYVGFGDDAIGSGNGEVYALDPKDGSEQWVTETGSVYHPPRLTDDALYVGSDDGMVYCLDRGAGEVRWTTSIEPTDESGPRAPEVAAVSDGVAVVELDDSVLGLGASDGTRQWQFAPENTRITSVSVDDRVYLTTDEQVYALENGEQEWSCGHEGGRIETVTDETVYLVGSARVAAFEATDGVERWFVRTDDYPELETVDGAVYFGATGVRKLTPDGETQWETALDGSELRALVPAKNGVYAGTESGAYRLDDSGDVVGESDVAGIDLVVGDWVYTGSTDEIVALRL